MFPFFRKLFGLGQERTQWVSIPAKGSPPAAPTADSPPQPDQLVVEASADIIPPVNEPPLPEPGIEVPAQPVPEQTMVPRRIVMLEGSRVDMNRRVKEVLEGKGYLVVVWPNQKQDNLSIEARFVEWTDVGFAVVLLTGDDFVYPKNSKPAEARLRAPQKTILELGFLLGKYGRQRVFILFHEQKSFLLPTAVSDAIYTPWDEQGFWQKDLTARLSLLEYSPTVKKGSA